ncbi:uncharacterized protein LOC141711067 [Apium graveolens]|uniref:uncharacterized protein LOC141711067 n=1 Tax=Apium graveolens TaxID=4045 RepID=UPI003D7AAE15
MCLCGCKICSACLCLIAVVITIGVLFGFGVFKKAYHSVHNDIHDSVTSINDTFNGAARRGEGRPFFAPPPF